MFGSNQCSVDSLCPEGSFCNFGDEAGDAGTCEVCTRCGGPSGCHDCGLPTAGADDCSARCIGAGAAASGLAEPVVWQHKMTICPEDHSSIDPVSVELVNEIALTAIIVSVVLLFIGKLLSQFVFATVLTTGKLCTCGAGAVYPSKRGEKYSITDGEEDSTAPRDDDDKTRGDEEDGETKAKGSSPRMDSATTSKATASKRMVFRFALLVAAAVWFALPPLVIALDFEHEHGIDEDRVAVADLLTSSGAAPSFVLCPGMHESHYCDCNGDCGGSFCECQPALACCDQTAQSQTQGRRLAALEIAPNERHMQEHSHRMLEHAWDLHGVATALDNEIGVYVLGASLWSFIAAFFWLLGYYIVANDPAEAATGEKASKARANYHQLYVACNDCELTDGAAKVVSRSLERSFTPYRLSLQKHCFAEQGLSLLSDGLRTAATRDPGRKINAFDLRGVEVSWQSMSQLLITCNQPTKIKWSEALKRLFGTQITVRISACAVVGTAAVVVALVAEVNGDTKTMLLIGGCALMAIPTVILLVHLVLLVIKRCAADDDYKAQQKLEEAAAGSRAVSTTRTHAGRKVWCADEHPAWAGMKVRLRLKTTNTIASHHDSKWVGARARKENTHTLDNMWATPRKDATLAEASVEVMHLSPGETGSGPPAEVRHEVRAKLVKIYKVHHPEKIYSVDEVLREWHGDEQTFLAQVMEKYKIDSASFFDEAGAATPATPVTPKSTIGSGPFLSPKPAAIIGLCDDAKDNDALDFDLEDDSIETGTRLYRYKVSTTYDGVKHWLTSDGTLTDHAKQACCFLFEQLDSGFSLKLQPMRPTHEAEADADVEAEAPSEQIWEAYGCPLPLFGDDGRHGHDDPVFVVCICVDMATHVPLDMAQLKAEQVDGLAYRLIWQQEAGKTAGGGTLSDDIDRIQALAKRSVSIYIRITDRSSTRSVTLKRGQTWPLVQLEKGRTFDTHPDKNVVTKEIAHQTWEGPSAEMMWNSDIAEDSRSTKLKDARLKDGVLYRSEWNKHGLDLSKQLSKWAKVTAKIEVYLAQDLRTDQLVRDVLGTSFADPATIQRVLADGRYIDACRNNMLSNAPDQFWNTVMKVAKTRGGAVNKSSDQVSGGAKRHFGLSERNAVRGLHGALGLASSRGVVERMQLGNNTTTPGLTVSFPMIPGSLASSSLTKMTGGLTTSTAGGQQQLQQLSSGGGSISRRVFSRIPAVQMLLRIPATDDRADVMARMLQRNVIGSSFAVDPNAAAAKRSLEGFDYTNGTIAMGAAETRT